MSKYIGITIGPIFDTITQATSPAALWFASSFFSDVTKRLCRKLTGTWKDIQIASPYFGTDIKEGDGVGKFHDRILCSTNSFEEDALKQIIREVKQEVCENFPAEICGEKEREYIKNYLQINYVVLEESAAEKNIILSLSPYLDTLELMQTFPDNNDDSPFLSLFYGKGESKNEYVKESSLFRAIQGEVSQFKAKKDTFRSIEEIAADGTKTEKKYSTYFAVVSADGDGMGKYLENLNNEQVTAFSKACLEYDEAAAGLIGAFGGMTIYAGGDDLLFLAPVVNKEGKTIFRLCKEIGEEFGRILTGKEGLPAESKLPTLSFGVSLQYAKYPLYEALEKSRNLLWEAKNTVKDGVKDNIAFSLQKHSGQSVEMVIKNARVPVMQSILDCAAKDEDIMLQSVLHTLSLFQNAIEVVDVQASTMSENAYQEIWRNMFDNPGQQAAIEYIDKLAAIYYNKFLKEDFAGRVVTDENNRLENQRLQAFIYCLRVKKFMIEKREKE